MLVAIVALLAMGRAAGNDWAHYDDDLFLFRNPHYDPPTLESLAYYWSHSFKGLWTPVTHTAWWLVAKVAILDGVKPGGIRLNPWMFHAFNVLVHVATSVLAYLLAYRIVRSPWPAIAGAIVFAAHPVQVEAVAWATGTKDLLGALFTFAALLAATAPGHRSVLRIVLASLFAAVAMLSKPSAAVLPAMMLIVAWIFADRSRRSVIAAAVMAILAVPVILIARQVQDVAEVPATALITRPLVALDALVMHLRHIVWPVGLAADYGLTPTALLESPRRWWTWVVPVVLAALVLRTRDRVLIGGSLLTVIALAPNLGLTPFQFQVYSTVADRYAYPAMLGMAIIIARLLERAGHRAAIATAAIFMIALVPLSIVRCGDWQNGTTLWTRAIEVNPNSSLAHSNLGAAKADAGDLAAAIHHFEAAAANRGAAEGFALINLAQLHLRRGDGPAAADAVLRLIESYRRRADFDPSLEAQIRARFAREIARLDEAAARRLLEQANPYGRQQER